MNLILGYIDDLKGQTELLEALDWNEELMTEFVDELRAMLLAAPPNIDKALFWLRNTPWDCFDDAPLPESVANTVEKSIRNTAQSMREEISAKNEELAALPSLVDENAHTEWN